MKANTDKFAQFCFVFLGITFSFLSCISSIKDDFRRRESSSPIIEDQIIIDDDVEFSYRFDLGYSQKNHIAKQIFKNETGGNRSKLIHWNSGEDFPSLGIGHFIWIPRSSNAGFGDSFKEVVQFYKKNDVELPHFLKGLAPNYDCPWQNSNDFWIQRYDPKVLELETFLATTFDVQTSYLFSKLKESLPKILNGLSNEEKIFIDRNIKSIISTQASWYPIIDYLNFKGSGHGQYVTTEKGGWGLRQVLLGMQPSISNTDPVGAFMDSAIKTLTKRVELRNYDRRWLDGWSKRIETYGTFNIDEASSRFSN